MLRLRHVKVEQAAWKWRFSKKKLDLDRKSYRCLACRQREGVTGVITLWRAGDRYGGTLLKHSRDVHVRERQKLQGLQVMGDVKMLGCTLASGNGVGSGCPSPMLPVLEQQAADLPSLQRCMAMEKAGAAQPWFARNGRGSSRGLWSMNYVLCHIIMNW